MADLKISVDMKDIPAAVQATQRFERQINTLAAQLARGSITTATYQKALNQLSAKYRRLGVDINSARSAVMSYGRAAAEAAREQQALAAATQASSKGFARSGLVMQQTGYQVGDFLVQVQSGTNAFVAFGQQATQLAGLLTMSVNPKIIALGAGLSIAIPLLTALGAAFVRTRQNSSSATGGFTTMEAAMKAAREESTRMADEIERLNRGLKDNTQLNLTRAIEEQSRRVAQAQELVASSQLDPDGLLVAEEELRREQETLKTYQEQLQELQDQALELEGITFQREQELKTAQEALQLERDRRDFIAQETLDLENKIRLMEATLTYGEDSIEVERLRAYQARQAFLFEAMRNKLSLEQLTNLMAIYDEYARLNEILSKPVQGPNLPTTPPRTPRASGGASGPNVVERLQEEIAFRQRTINLSKEERNLQTEIFRITNALGKDRSKYSSDFIANLAQQNLAIKEQERVIEEARQQQEQLADSIANSFGDAFMSIVDGTKSTKDAFKQMAAAIVRDLYQVYVMKRLIGSAEAGTGIAGAIGRLISGRESGGSMMPNQPYIVGERGPELVIPGRSATVMNADLTRKSMGGSDGVVVNQTINVNGGTDPAAIRQEVAKLMPAITNATKTAVIDARRRGGQMKAAFQ